MPSIGFILLTHANEVQILRLVHALSQTFGDPPIACHHDFSKTSLNKSLFPARVRFVESYVNTSWGTISLVTATLKALQLLYDTSAPDWFYLLSGSDYPIRDAALIRDELANTPYDAYIRLKKIDHTRVPERAAEDTGGLDSSSYQRLAYQRYVGRSLPIPSLKHPFRGPAARHLHLLNPALLKPFHPFNERYRCYAGDQWFAANARGAAALLNRDNERLLRYLTGRFPPDEAFCPTVLGNAPDLNICPESKHYIRWEAGNHPRFLDTQDLPDLLRSEQHFARKFAPGAAILDFLDSHLHIAAMRP